jgi:hypothetical protein
MICFRKVMDRNVTVRIELDWYDGWLLWRDQGAMGRLFERVNVLGVIILSLEKITE